MIAILHLSCLVTRERLKSEPVNPVRSDPAWAWQAPTPPPSEFKNETDNYKKLLCDLLLELNAIIK